MPKPQDISKLPSIEFLRDAFDYDPSSGALIWKNPGGASNRRHIGKRAGTVNKKGRRWVGLCGKLLLASRIAWAIHHGAWPSGLVDHRNLDPGDDSADNLREATNSQNSMNVPCHAASGMKGAYRMWNGSWYSRINAEGRSVYLGRFDSREEAAAAYQQASARYHGEFGSPI